MYQVKQPKQHLSLFEKGPYSGLFWSAFFRILTEYGENADQNNFEYGQFLRSVFHSSCLGLNNKYSCNFQNFHINLKRVSEICCRKQGVLLQKLLRRYALFKSFSDLIIQQFLLPIQIKRTLALCFLIKPANDKQHAPIQKTSEKHRKGE